MVTVTEDRLTGAPIPPTVVRGESGKRLMQHFLDITDPRLCVVEMDIYWAHVAQHQWRWRYDWDGNRVEDIFDPTAQVARQTKRYALFHAKDGDRTDRPARRGQRLQLHPVRRPAQRHRLRAVLPQDRRARASTTPTTSRTTPPAARADPGQSLRFSQDQRAQHATAARLIRTAAAVHIVDSSGFGVVRISDWLIHTRDRNAKLVAGSLV